MQTSWQLVKVTIVLGDGMTCHLEAGGVSCRGGTPAPTRRLPVWLGGDITLHFVTLTIPFYWKAEMAQDEGGNGLETLWQYN